MNISQYALTLALCALLPGCASVQNPFSSDKTFAGISPPSMHRRDDDGRRKQKMAGITEKVILDAEAKPFIEYYEALKRASEANDAQTRQALIDDYVLKGITVVNISCSRWFNSLAESQSRFAFTQNNQNVIQNLGTTLLGLGKANPIVVGTYGAAFAGLNGIEDNFSQSFLLAPNANKVKEHIFTALDQQAAQLRRPQGSDASTPNAAPSSISLRPTSFTEAYMALEKYSDICTQQTSKEIVNSALDQTKTTILANQGNKILTATTEESRDRALIKLSSDVLAMQNETAKAISQLQTALNNANSTNDLKTIKNQVDELAKKLTNPTPPQVQPPTTPPPQAPTPQVQ